MLVPLGARQVDGVVVAVAEGDDDELKPIDEVIGRVPPALLELAVWMADEYGSTAGPGAGAGHPAAAAEAGAEGCATTSPTPTSPSCAG